MSLARKAAQPAPPGGAQPVHACCRGALGTPRRCLALCAAAHLRVRLLALPDPQPLPRLAVPHDAMYFCCSAHPAPAPARACPAVPLAPPPARPCPAGGRQIFFCLDENAHADFVYNGRKAQVPGPACVPCRAGDSHGIYNSSARPFRWFNINCCMPGQVSGWLVGLMDGVSSRPAALVISSPPPSSAPRPPPPLVRAAAAMPAVITAAVRCCVFASWTGEQSYDATDLEAADQNSQPGGAYELEASADRIPVRDTGHHLLTLPLRSD
eukprot:SAG22_NODE_48_length_24654_cov_4.406394_17_plen_268_part_00